MLTMEWNSKPTRRTLNKKRIRLSNLSPYAVRGAKIVAKEIDNGFRQGRIPGTKTRWKPNAKTTVQRKKSSRPNIDTGNLRRSIRVSGHSNGNILAETDIAYAAYPNATRPYFPEKLDDSIYNKLAKEFTKHMGK